jgi:hypothetical protein
MEIIYNKQIEPHNKAEIASYLKHYVWLVPSWCQHLYVGLWDSKGDSAIATCVDYEYRRITLDFYSCWLTQSDYMKRDNIIHECIHFNVNHLFNEARSAVKILGGDDEKLKDYAYEQLRMAVESVTQDLSHAIHNKFNEQG